MDLASSGRLNRIIGWTLLVAGFTSATWLDPWSLSERDPSLLVGSPRMAIRHAQAVVLGMAFLQLVVAHVLTTVTLASLARRTAAGLSSAGAALYAAGYALSAGWADSAWLVPVGALMNFAAFVILAWASGRQQGRPELRVVLLIICFGMVLDAVMGLFAASPTQFLPTYIGAEDGIRLRMLRLAQAAVIALSVLTLLYQGLAREADPHHRAIRWGRNAMFCGTVGMPVILTAAAFTTVRVKSMLPIPALAMLAGTLVGVWMASRHARRLELWGWLLIALSMAAGLVMGTYAFDGPFPTPDFLGTYNEFTRRLSRLAHSYCIVLGMLSIFISREREKNPDKRWTGQVGVPLFVVGSLATIGVILLQMVADLPLSALTVGPALVVIGTIVCIGQAVKLP